MKESIILKSCDMFLTHGFKSITMDEIASEMGISKKTIYQHFSNKSALVEEVSSYLFETISCGIDQIYEQDANPIEELFLIRDFVLKNLKDESASPFHQLQKFYPKIHKSLMGKQFEKMKDCVVNNINKGIEQEFFRKNLNADLIVRFYYAGMSSLKDVELFDPHQFSTKLVQTEYLEYHLRGICTEKGIKKLEELITKYNF
ncbi:TetR/AcrR family transcriptional regulator [Flavobacterium capsici]|uniref:TetR/AcrR family transcriptional regulator n=1 Tax=Flavobacterium capsici TaxID=3075618 RepID=A0AA96J7E5_9FLAO|nr:MULTISPECIES: TetR/AcrR family transcriptional regulator [unclassified Flavobacterium]WNM19852.1 TetR/AcrR family transcriptional regulator [Flavobacterium sp. PMR2A8]WNM21241.1 TetR/AcrR family transcriptional regulator [Flavobacterium sp. PMTSA4]